MAHQSDSIMAVASRVFKSVALVASLFFLTLLFFVSIITPIVFLLEVTTPDEGKVRTPLIRSSLPFVPPLRALTHLFKGPHLLVRRARRHGQV